MTLIRGWHLSHPIFRVFLCEPVGEDWKIPHTWFSGARKKRLTMLSLGSARFKEINSSQWFVCVTVILDPGGQFWALGPGFQKEYNKSLTTCTFLICELEKRTLPGPGGDACICLANGFPCSGWDRWCTSCRQTVLFPKEPFPLPGPSLDVAH